MNYITLYLSMFTPILAIFIFFFFVLIIAIAVKASNKPRSAKEIGDSGEQQVAYMLEHLQRLIGGYVINNITLPYKDSHAQIDHMFFTRKGLFVIETKNYSGRVYGDGNQKYWTQVLAYGEEKHKLYNPMLQNNRHIRAINNVLHNNIETISVVIFVKGNIRHINCEHVFSVEQARSFMVRCPDQYDDKKVLSAYNTIAKYKKSLRTPDTNC